MELELGLKITRLRDDVTSTDFRIAKDSAGLVFLSRETESMFILIAHLKGLVRENIKIDINEDGTQIAIRGEKPIQEMIMVGWTMYKKDVEMWRLKKVFKIPDGVVLDRIKAKFNEEESVLTINMPKSAKGIKGVEIEEVKEEAREDVKELKEAEIKDKDIEETDKAGEKLSEASEIRREKEFDSKIIAEKMKYQESGNEKQEEVESEKETEKAEKTEETEQPKTEEAGAAKENPRLMEEKKKEEILETGTRKEVDAGLEDDVESTNETGKIMEQSDMAKTESAQRTQVEEENAEGEIPLVETEMPKQDLRKTDIEQEVEELEKPPISALDHPADEEKCGEEEYHEQVVGEEIQEEKSDDDGKLHEAFKEANDQQFSSSSEEEKQDQAIEAIEAKKPSSDKFKLCAPCFFAGSAFLVSLIVLVVHLIRPRKR